MDGDIILRLLDILPQWFVMVSIFLLILHRICDKNIKMLIKLIGKWKIRDERKNIEQDRRLGIIENSLNEEKEKTTKVGAKVDFMIRLLQEKNENRQ